MYSFSRADQARRRTRCVSKPNLSLFSDVCGCYFIVFPSEGLHTWLMTLGVTFEYAQMDRKIPGSLSLNHKAFKVRKTTSNPNFKQAGTVGMRIYQGECDQIKHSSRKRQGQFTQIKKTHRREDKAQMKWETHLLSPHKGTVAKLRTKNFRHFGLHILNFLLKHRKVHNIREASAFFFFQREQVWFLWQGMRGKNIKWTRFLNKFLEEAFKYKKYKQYV